MLKCTKFIIKLNLFVSLFLLNSCSLFNSNTEYQPTNDVFTKAQTLVNNNEFKSAIPFLKLSLEQNNQNYNETLFLSARAYDQLSEPDNSIAALNEYILRDELKMSDLVRQFTVNTLLLKNQFKAEINTYQNKQKKIIQSILALQNFSKKDIITATAWSLDFNCDQYCLAEIKYLNEIQTSIFYVVELDADEAEKAANILIQKYGFFYSYLRSDLFDTDYKKKIAKTLYESIQKLKKLDITKTENLEFSKSKYLFAELEPIEKNLESWTK
jgi:hypothetical protein